MSTNANLHKAKRAKDDEFYTQYKDIETEIENYYDFNTDFLRGRIVYCPCDDYERSNFVKYLVENEERFGYRKLIATARAKIAGQRGITIPATWGEDKVLADRLKASATFDSTHGKSFTLEKGAVSKGYLEGDGDFRSRECTRIRNESDIIITNPPFSIFGEFWEWLHGKRFLILGSNQVVSRSYVFPMLKSGEVRVGANEVHYFRRPDGTLANVCAVWYSNLARKPREPYEYRTMADLRASAPKDWMRRYDNLTDAVEVKSINLVPSDYDGLMGVAINFVYKRWCPEQFELIRVLDPVLDGKEIFKRVIIRRRR